MLNQRRVVAFDIDGESLISLREAFPHCHIDEIGGATSDTLDRDWSPAATELLVVGVREPVAASLGLCRALRSQVGRASTSLLVLVPPAQEALVRAALDAGANSCLVLPVHVKELVSVVNRAQNGNQPGRHTLDLSRAQRADPWRDDGGES
jgi:DNA-binding response OmpR family regulator